MAEYGTLSNTGGYFWFNGTTPALMVNVCMMCGAVVFDKTLHDKFHE